MDAKVMTGPKIAKVRPEPPVTEACRDPEQLDPDFRAVLDAALAEANTPGLCEFRVIETYRSQARQDWIYAQGRTRHGIIVTNARNSKHTLRMAADVGAFINGKYDGNTRRFYDAWGEVAMRHGLIWGGHFRNYDGAHAQDARA